VAEHATLFADEDGGAHASWVVENKRTLSAASATEKCSPRSS